MIDINDISYKNQKTWDLIGSGRTVGVFQLESNLGQTWARKLKPTNINELSALIALMRPAGLETGMLEKYCKIKNGEEPRYTFNDKDVDSILAPTYGILTFQEQLMFFGSRIAWKDKEHLEKLVIVDKLRKGIGKKDSNLLQELRESFVSGCIKNGKKKDLAEELFQLILSAGRYAFNDAHAKKYALWGYNTAYLKANHPYEFYTTYMTYSKAKQKPQEELRGLIYEGKCLGINILHPDIKRANNQFRIVESEDRKAIAYGLTHIKYVGDRDVDVLRDNQISNWSQLVCLHFDKKLEKKIKSTALNTIIGSGAADYLGIERSVLLDVVSLMKELAGKELEFVVGEMNKTPEMSLEDFKKLVLRCADEVSMKRRKDYVRSEINELDLSKKDSFRVRAEQEKVLLGLAMSCSAIDDKDVKQGTYTCKDCNSYSDNNKYVTTALPVILDEIIKLKTKRGKNPGQEMAQILFSDKTSQIKVACFPDAFSELKDKLFEGMVYNIVISGTGNGWCLENLKEIR